MHESYFDEGFRSLGMWWRPGDDSALAGELAFDPAEGIRLTLIDVANWGQLRSESDHPPILHGQVADGTISSVITLTGCVHQRSQATLGGVMARTYRVNRAFFGAQLDGEALSFSSAEVYVDQFQNWITETSLAVSVEFERNIPTQQQVAFNEPQIASARVGSAELSVGFLKTIPGGVFRSVRVTELPYVGVRYQKPQPIQDILDEVVFPLQNLSTLATNKRARITAIVLRGPADERAPEVRLLYHQIPSRGTVLSPLFAEEMLVMTRDASFQRLVERWLPFANGYRDVCDLYFSVEYSPDLLPDAAFFMLAQVAESYHRDRFPGPETPEMEHAARCAAILQAIPIRLRTWLAQKLQFVNEISFRKRLRALVAPDSATLLPYLGGKIPDFVDAVVATRNYMAHRTPDLKKRASHGVRLRRLSDRLRLVLKARFLEELGCNPTERAAIIQRHMSVRAL